MTEAQKRVLARIAACEASIFGPIEARRIYLPTARVLRRMGLTRPFAPHFRHAVLTRAGWDMLYTIDPEFVHECAVWFDKERER